MKKLIAFILGLILPFLTVYSQNKDNKQQKAPKETQVLFATTAGNIKVKLYNETPKHRDNFIKLAKEHFYDSLLFHRVISEFMIQGGDPDSKKAPQGIMLGNGGLDYTIPAEFMPAKYFHKKGALAAARMGDDVNPLKASSSCQFYIVQGKKFALSDLDRLSSSKMQMKKQEMFNKIISAPMNAELRSKFMKYQMEKKMDSLAMISQQIEPLVMAELMKEPPLTFSEEQKQIYTTVGGTPHLDGGYTVFGEVVEGLDIIDKISQVAKDQYDRPTQDVRIIKATVIE